MHHSVSPLLHLAAPEPYFLSHCVVLPFFYPHRSALSSSTSILKRPSSRSRCASAPARGKDAAISPKRILWINQKETTLPDREIDPSSSALFHRFVWIRAVRVLLTWSSNAIKRIGRISNVSQEEEVKEATAAWFWSGLPAENCLFRLQGASSASLHLCILATLLPFIIIWVFFFPPRSKGWRGA